MISDLPGPLGKMRIQPIAFLGVGLMGAPMAARLIARGLDVRLWNRSAEKLARLESAGGRACGRPSEAAAGCAFICLCLTDASAVEQVVFGVDGVAETAAEQSIVLDFSTIGPEASRRMAERLNAACGAAWLDCPVSGGVAGAETGTLSVMAGGAVEPLRTATPLLEELAARITHMGPCGAGQSAKLCNQLIVATNMLAIAEAMNLGAALGVDVAQLPTALSGGFADSRPLQIFGARMAVARDPGPPVSQLKTMMKDIGAILDTAGAEGVDVPLLERVGGLYQAAIDAGLGVHDVPGLMLLYREHLLDLGARDASH
jgi:3-hydroxyisobutyrate dehydrogenase-like beta-hydroxyacid dehydrogenase